MMGSDDVISCCWDLKISNFLKLYIDYYLSKFQIFWLSGSNFINFFFPIVFGNDLIMTSFIIVKLSNLPIL